MPWHGGTIAAGRSLRVIETRIDQIGSLVALGWLAGMLIIAAVAVLARWMWPVMG
jgi:hypothetical protein